MKKLFAIILSLSLIIAPIPAAHAAGDGYAKQILGISNGVMGATILTKCQMGTMQLSVLAYMAGGLVFVASEIAGGKAQGNKLKGMSADLENLKANMTEGGDYQKAAIDAQIKDEKATLEHIQKRRKWMMATKAVYAAATALAILENWWRLPYPAGINKPDKAGCKHMEGSHKPLVQTIISAYSTFLGAGGDMKSTAMMMAAKTIAQFAFKIEIGTTVASKAIKIMDNALGRIAFFAAATAVVQVIDSGLAKEEKKTKQKIADLEKVKAQFTGTGTSIAEGSSNSNSEGGANSGASGGTNAGSGSVNSSTNGNYAIKELPKGVVAENKTCYSNASGATEYSESACKNPIQFNRPKFDMNMELPTLVAGVNAATDLGQAFADGDMAKADLAAASLNSMAGRIDSIKDGLMAKLNDQLKKDGKKPIDVNGELQRQVDDLNKGLNEASPGSGNYNVASLGLDALKSGAAEVSENSLSGNKVDGNNITTAGTDKSVEMPAPDLNLNSLSESDLTGTAGSSDIDHMLDDKSGKLAALQSMDKSGANANEIAPDSDVSLFKQVSNRYFLNYGKMFERKKINPPEAAPSP